MARRFWTAAEDESLRGRYAETPTVVLARELQRTERAIYMRAKALGLSKSAEYLASAASGRLQRADHRGRACWFPKGHVPHNKGLRRPGWGPGRMKATQFQPGERRGVAAKNWQPISTVREDAEGYLRIKVREAVSGEAYGFGNVRVWPLLQRHAWEQAHGPIPPAHAVCFKDGNRHNCALGNLELVSRADLMRRNSVHNLPAPLPQTIQLLGALKRQIRKRTNGEEQDQRSA